MVKKLFLKFFFENFISEGMMNLKKIYDEGEIFSMIGKNNEN